MPDVQDRSVRYVRLGGGEWGVKGPNDLVVPGRWVTISISRGRKIRERVKRVIWYGDGLALGLIHRLTLRQKQPKEKKLRPAWSYSAPR